MTDKRSELILNSVQDVIFEFDAQGNYLGIWANDEALLAIPREQMSGKKISDVFPAEQAKFYTNLIGSVIENQEKIEINYSIMTPKGETFFKGEVVPLNYGSEVPTVALYATDVTNQVKLQEAFDDQKNRLDSILESTESVVFECLLIDSKNISFPFISRQIYDVFNLMPETVTRDASQMLALLDSNQENKFSEFLIESSKKLTKAEWVGDFLAQDNRRRWVQINLSPRKVAKDKILFNGIILDVTKRKSGEIELEKEKTFLNHQLKLASLGELCAGIGHEINNPLQIINSIFFRMEKLLKRNKLSQDSFKDFVAMGKEATERILIIIEGLKVFSRGDSFNRETFNLNDSVALSVKLIGEICRSKNIAFNFISTDQDCKIDGNRGHIDQVLMNLISNSIDALADQDNGLIEVKLSREGESCVISVEDNGPGIPGEIKDKVFDHFYSSKEVGKGTGIGLSVVNRIVDDHKGKVSFTSSDEGTTFKVVLPPIKD